MYTEKSISSLTREDYNKEKENIDERALVFLEDEERLITPFKEYQFVPSGGEQGQLLIHGENGIEWGNIPLNTKVFKVVESLPETPESGEEETIHLVKSKTSENGNLYAEYLYVNGAWEKFGEFHATIDLSDYVSKTEYNSLKATVETMKSKLDSLPAITEEMKSDNKIWALVNGAYEDIAPAENSVVYHNPVQAAALKALSEMYIPADTDKETLEGIRQLLKDDTLFEELVEAGVARVGMEPKSVTESLDVIEKAKLEYAEAKVRKAYEEQMQKEMLEQMQKEMESQIEDVESEEIGEISPVKPKKGTDVEPKNEETV